MAKRHKKSGCVKRSVKYCYRKGRSHHGKKVCGRRTICARPRR